MQLQMQSPRFDRQRSPERTLPNSPDFYFDRPAEIQRQQHQHHQKTRDREGMAKTGARKPSCGSNNNTGVIRDVLQSRRDDCRLHSPPSSPRLAPTTLKPNTNSNTTSTPSPRNGRAGHTLSLSIPPRLLRSDWVSLEGLVSVALACLNKEECTRISELGEFFFLAA
jgi:hypothetical protein